MFVTHFFWSSITIGYRPFTKQTSYLLKSKFKHKLDFYSKDGLMIHVAANKF